MGKSEACWIRSDVGTPNNLTQHAAWLKAVSFEDIASVVDVTLCTTVTAFVSGLHVL